MKIPPLKSPILVVIVPIVGLEAIGYLPIATIGIQPNNPIKQSLMEYNPLKKSNV